MKTNIHFLSYPAHFFIELEMFQKKTVEKIETNFVLNDFSKILPSVR